MSDTITRNCSNCGTELEITIYDDDTYEGGHFWDFDFGENGELWECDPCYEESQ